MGLTVYNSRGEPVGAVALTYEKTATFVFSGELAVTTGKVRLHVPRAGVIENVTATAATAPTGAAIIVDVNKNGTTIFTTQANRPTIAAGTNDDLSNVPDVTVVAKDDVLTCDIDQVGSTVAGDTLVVEVRMTLSTE